jgi:hypothetical protein
MGEMEKLRRGAKLGQHAGSQNPDDRHQRGEIGTFFGTWKLNFTWKLDFHDMPRKANVVKKSETSLFVPTRIVAGRDLS